MINHEKIAAGFEQGLEEIRETLNRCKVRMNRLKDTRRRQYVIIQMFIEVFGFLTDMMQWFNSKHHRFFSSFNKDFYADHVQHWVTKIEKRENTIWNESSIEHQSV